MEIVMPKLHSRAERREQETDMANISPETFEMGAQ
jgi:hypothetical protein